MRTPGVYVEEAGPHRTIPAASTSVTAFIGTSGAGPTRRARRVRSWRDYQAAFGPLSGEMGFAARSYFDNGGTDATVMRIGRGAGVARWRHALELVDGCNLMVLPDLRGLSEARRSEILALAANHCAERRIFLIVDPPAAAASVTEITAWAAGLAPLLGRAGRNVAAYWPDLVVDEGGAPRRIGASGAVAGIFARTDATRGVWKAPAGSEAKVMNVTGTSAQPSKPQLDLLADAGINPVRLDRGTILLWGARTLASGDADWKYVPVRRLALMIQESVYRGLQWAVFEPNDEPLWMSVRWSVEIFLNSLWREGAFPGRAPREAYYVKCDRSTMTQADIDSGRLVVEIGMAPLKPAEFIVIRIGLWTAKPDP